jgi:hypothetical protein
MSIKTHLSIEGQKFFINNLPSYAGRSYQGRSLEGLLFNARMIQAIFDDENPDTAKHWRYPDTGVWDAERNTKEFCDLLPVYKQHGLLGITVGLQGGGSNYTPEIYNNYHTSAFYPDGSLKTPYFSRLERVLKTADDCSMVVIVSYFYVASMKWLENEQAVKCAVLNTTQWLLETGYQNLIVEIYNEVKEDSPFVSSKTVASYLEMVKQQTLQGRRLLVGNSAFPDRVVPTKAWLEAEDVTMPHGNNHTPTELKQKLRHWKSLEPIRKRPRPLIINEDSTLIANLEAALEEGVSWGFYHQGYGSESTYDRFVDWARGERETTFETLSGFQTLPVNWCINDPWKEHFFTHLKRITGGFQ